MAKRNIPNQAKVLLNRRRLLGTAAAVTAAGILPTAKAAECERVVGPAAGAQNSEAPPNISATMGGKLAEITRRNQLRREADLPLLSVARELRQMKTIEAAADCAKFSEIFASRVRDKTLARMRRRIGDPGWKPMNKWEGLAFENEVGRHLRVLYGRVVGGGLQTQVGCRLQTYTQHSSSWSEGGKCPNRSGLT